MGLKETIEELENLLHAQEGREYVIRLKGVVEELEKYRANSQEEIRRSEDIINRLSKKVDHLEGRVENVAKKGEIVDLNVRVVCELSYEADKSKIVNAINCYLARNPKKRFSFTLKKAEICRRFDRGDFGFIVFRAKKRVYSAEGYSQSGVDDNIDKKISDALDLAFAQNIVELYDGSE